MSNPHKNARTCVYSREQIVARHVRGETICDIAAAFGICVRTVHKWLSRHREHGLEGLHNRSSRPFSNALAFTAACEDLIARLRTFRLTALDIAGALSMARSTVAHVLKRMGLNRRDRLNPPEPVRRYERERPGDLIHIDIKKLGRFAQTGHRITGHHKRKRSRHLGYDYVHVAIDDHSRLAYVEVLADEKGETCARFLARATQWFDHLGVTVRRVMSDNGVGYRAHVFRDAARALGQRHIRTRPYTPKTNGKAERFIKTLQEEWAYAIAFTSSQERNDWLPRWLHIYNCERPHGGINMKTPISRLKYPA
jgi:transposase InsO family protein